MSKNLIRILVYGSILIVIFIIINNIFFPTSVSYYDDDYTNAITYKDNIIYINYSKMNLLLEDINDYIDYGDNLSNIYNEIIDKYYNDRNIKLYDKGNYKVMDIKYDKNTARSLFSNFYDINNNIIVRVLFNKDYNLKNIDLSNVDYKINREDNVRKKIVKSTQDELGVYGDRYWKWYGVNYRMQWCCVFVSYIANKNGILNDFIPKFTSVKTGVKYFSDKNQLKMAKSYTPKPGDIVFFDFPSDYLVDHVGIVEKVKDGIVYTIEGNANSDYVKRKTYNINSSYLYAYGVPDYENVK